MVPEPCCKLRRMAAEHHDRRAHLLGLRLALAAPALLLPLERGVGAERLRVALDGRSGPRAALLFHQRPAPLGAEAHAARGARARGPLGRAARPRRPELLPELPPRAPRWRAGGLAQADLAHSRGRVEVERHRAARRPPLQLAFDPAVAPAEPDGDPAGARGRDLQALRGARLPGLSAPQPRRETHGQDPRGGGAQSQRPHRVAGGCRRAADHSL
mmetsp:Transcript_42486/g.110580  ORF Transcript_42486/g.110580 Transcript_42486/m.110580 type:complete len:215 (+) Transcript_42486:1125-1769(+)